MHELKFMLVVTFVFLFLFRRTECQEQRTGSQLEFLIGMRKHTLLGSDEKVGRLLFLLLGMCLY